MTSRTAWARPVPDTLPADRIPVATDVSGEPLPDIETEALDGDAVPLRSLTGEPLVLNFWYSTCLPCRKEMPAFQQVHEELGPRVRLIGINPSTAPSGRRTSPTRSG